MTPEKVYLVLSALFLLSPAAYAANISVCPSGCSYSSIQAAINTASAGDTIIVGDGSYKESVIVNKSVSIRSENGPAKTSVEASDSDPSYVFSINSNYVNLTGFTVNGSDNEGVWIFYSSFCRIERICVRTVASDTNEASAMAAEGSPSMRRASTSHSRWVMRLNCAWRFLSARRCSRS